jgi:hypothetical protein
MASPNSSWSEIITTTIQSRSRKLADNVSENTAILQRLKQKGRIKTVSGGNVIAQELEYAENGTFTWYSGYEPLSIQVSDVISAAEFAWKQAAVAVTISGLEMLQNSGKEKMIDLLSSRIKNAEKTMVNTIATAMYSDGTGSGSKEIGGLQHLVSNDSTTGTVGGIARGTYSFWRNVVHDVSNAGSTASTTTIQDHMNRIYVQLVRNNEAPDLILADNNYYRFYLGSLQTIQRITNDKMASAGFINLKYMNADVVLDGGKGGNCPANTMYFLNTDYIHFRPHADRNMVPLDPDRFSTNQDALVKLIGFAGNMTASNCSLQGVLKT